MKGDRGWVATADDLDWIESAAAPVHPVLAEIEEAAIRPRVPILDRDSGRVLAVLAGDRRRIVEIGTAFGYSTLWMALAQPADGTIVTVDPDRARTTRAKAWWRAAGIADGRVTVVDAPALDAFATSVPELAGPFDLAFIDALKDEYAAYLEALIPRLALHALVVADNVLWSGKVARSAAGAGTAGAGASDSTAALAAFDRSVLADERFSATILPVGDGLLIARFRGTATS